jgi:hypothetical protein
MDSASKVESLGSSIGCVVQPDHGARCRSIDVAHHLDLSCFFYIVVLVDTDRINSHVAIAIRTSQAMKNAMQIRRHVKWPIVHPDLSYGQRIAPDITQCLEQHICEQTDYEIAVHRGASSTCLDPHDTYRCSAWRERHVYKQITLVLLFE